VLAGGRLAHPQALGELADGQLPIDATRRLLSGMNHNPNVDRWFDQADHPLGATMRRARDIILGADGA
jgi:hypothetical protein